MMISLYLSNYQNNVGALEVLIWLIVLHALDALPGKALLLSHFHSLWHLR